MKYIGVLFIAMILVNCTPKEDIALISEADFAYNQDGKDIKLFTIKNQNGLVCQLTNFGGRVVSLWVPDKDGKLGDVVVGYGTGDDFVNKQEQYFGGTIGRYGNRIGAGQFILDSVEYQLPINDGLNHLHGGSEGFHRKIWNVDEVTDNALTFSYLSPDMQEGYPGNVKVKVTFELTEDNALKIVYVANTDKPTILNLTNHTYFNLADAGAGTINDHKLMIQSDYYTPVDSVLITTGEIVPVAGTPFDFNSLTAIGARVNQDDQQLIYGAGYDHNWVLKRDNDGLLLAAKVVEPVSGRIMEVYTIEPGLQFYGGNFLDGTTLGKAGIMYQHRSAFCLETQHYPDSPNKPNFPSVKLLPGEKYYSECVYKFL